MVASSTLVPTASFLPSSALAAASSSSTSATSSTASLPLRVASTLLVTPLLWSFRQLGLSSGSSAGHAEAGDRVLAKVQGSYIVKPVLEVRPLSPCSSRATLQALTSVRTTSLRCLPGPSRRK